MAKSEGAELELGVFAVNFYDIRFLIERKHGDSIGRFDRALILLSSSGRPPTLKLSNCFSCLLNFLPALLHVFSRCRNGFALALQSFEELPDLRQLCLSAFERFISRRLARDFGLAKFSRNHSPELIYFFFSPGRSLPGFGRFKLFPANVFEQGVGAQFLWVHIG